jgi:hypothetical protein
MLHVHVLSMAGALLAANPARHRARLNLRLENRTIRVSYPGEYVTRGSANVRAVEVQSDAAHEFLEVLLLAQTGIRTGGAGLGAIEALLNTGGQGVLVCPGLAGVRSQHLLYLVHDRPSFGAAQEDAD